MLDELIAARVRLLQTIVGALLAGVAFFAAVAVTVRARQGMAPPDTPLVSLIAGGYTVVMFSVRAFVSRTMLAAARRRLSTAEADVSGWLNVYQTQTIIGAAFLEGSAFFLLIAYLVEGTSWTLPAALAVWLLLAWLHVPTRGGVERWLAEQHEAARREGRGA